MSNYRIHGPAEPAHENYSEAFVERDIRQIAAILVNDMEMSGPVFCDIAGRGETLHKLLTVSETCLS